MAKLFIILAIIVLMYFIDIRLFIVGIITFGILYLTNKNSMTGGNQNTQNTQNTQNNLSNLSNLSLDNLDDMEDANDINNENSINLDKKTIVSMYNIDTIAIIYHNLPLLNPFLSERVLEQINRLDSDYINNIILSITQKNKTNEKLSYAYYTSLTLSNKKADIYEILSKFWYIYMYFSDDVKRDIKICNICLSHPNMIYFYPYNDIKNFKYNEATIFQPFNEIPSCFDFIGYSLLSYIESFLLF